MNDTQASELEGKLFDIAIGVRTEVPIPRLAVAQIIHAIVPTMREWLAPITPPTRGVSGLDDADRKILFPSL